MKPYSFTVAIACLLCWCFVSLKGAWADLYWDTNGSTAGASNSTTAGGDWYSPALNWSTDPTGKSTTKGWVSGETAVFSAGTNATGFYTVYISSSVKLSGIRVEEGAPEITSVTNSGAALEAANLAIDTGGNRLDLNMFLNSPVSGGLITKTGSGDLWAHQSQTTFEGKWVINQGTFHIDDDFDLGAIPTTTIPDEITLNGSTLEFESLSASPDPHRGITLGAGGGVLGSPPLSGISLSDPITGSLGGALQLGGTFTLSNTNNNYDGPTIIVGTALHLGASGVIPDTSVVNVGGGSTFDLHNFNETIKSLSSSITSSVTPAWHSYTRQPSE